MNHNIRKQLKLLRGRYIECERYFMFCSMSVLYWWHSVITKFQGYSLSDQVKHRGIHKICCFVITNKNTLLNGIHAENALILNQNTKSNLTLNYLQHIVCLFQAYTTYSKSRGMGQVGVLRYVYMHNDREGYFRTVNHIVN